MSVRDVGRKQIHPQGGVGQVGRVETPKAKAEKVKPDGYAEGNVPKAAKADFKGFVGSSRFGGNVVDQIVTALSFGSMTVDDLAHMFKRDVDAGILANAHLNEAKAKVMS